MRSIIPRRSEALKAVLAPCLPAETSAWLKDSCRLFQDGMDLVECYVRFAEVSGRLGTARLRCLLRSEADLRASGLSPETAEWSLDECGRVVLLAQAAAHLSEDKLADLVESCYFQGETRERQGIVRSLWYLPRTDRLLQIGLDAGRTHVQPLFDALACENAFPAEAFPDTSFNHLVLKALFTEVRLARLVGLPTRMTSELRRMVSDFVDERRAAGRPIPADVALILPAKGGTR